MKRLAINANGNTITSFAIELNPTGAGEYISLSSSTGRSVSLVYAKTMKKICFDTWGCPGGIMVCPGGIMVCPGGIMV